MTCADRDIRSLDGPSVTAIHRHCSVYLALVWHATSPACALGNCFLADQDHWAMCLPVPGRRGSGRLLAGSLIPDRTPWLLADRGGPVPTIAASPQADVDLIADVVYRTFSIHQDLHVEPQHREAFLIPQMLVMALGSTSPCSTPHLRSGRRSSVVR
jgi:hypothetical protein